MRRISLVLLLVSALRSGAVAAAEPQAKDSQAVKRRESAARRIVVDHFQGEGGQRRIRSEVTSVLEQEQSIDLVSVKLLDAHRTHDVSIDGSAEGYAEIATRLNVVALIRGRVAKSEGQQVLSLVVLNGADGRRLGRVELKAASLKALREQVGTQLWRELEPLLAQAGSKEAPSEEAANDAADAAEDDAETEAKIDRNPYLTSSAVEPRQSSEPTPPPEPSSRAARYCSWLEIMTGGALITRSFDYENERSGALRQYSLGRSPLMALEVTWYPGALANCELSSGIGLRLGYEQLLGVSSHVANQDLDTSGLAARAELVFRVPIGPVSVEPAVGYYRRSFSVERDYVPDVDYQALGGGLKIDVRLGLFIVEARGGARFVQAAGQLKTNPWFPEANGLGFDAAALIGIAPVRWLDVFVSANVERYAFDLNQTEPTDGSVPPVRANGVADAAHDHFTSFGLGLRFRLSKHRRR